MRSFDAVLGRHDVTVVAPEAGTDPAEVARLFTATFPPAPRRPYGLDVETTYLTPRAQFDPDFRVRLIQFGVETRPPVGEHRGAAVAWVLRMDDPAQRAAALELLADRRVTFASHSNMDVLSAAALGVDITARNVDTLSLAQMADPDKEEDRDLKTVSRQHLGTQLAEADDTLYARFLELYRAEHPELGRRAVKRSTVEAWGWAHISPDDPVYLLYAGLDAVAVHLVAPLLVRATRAPARLLEVEQFLDVQANRIQLRGKRVDVEALDALHAEAEREVGAAEVEVLEATSGVKARSPKLIEWLGGHGVDWDRWEGARSDTTGAPSLAKDNVRLLYDFPLDDAGRAAVDGLVRLRGHLDLLNKTNGVREHLDPYGYVHPVLNPRGATTTARMSSAGPNFQNFSKRDPRMRGIFLPEPGHTLVTIDFDQVELRVVAALAREEKMIDVVLAGGDLHQLTVDELAEAGITITRDVGKMANFLIVYAGGGKALHQQSGIPLAQSAEIVRAHRERYTSIAAYSRYLGMEREAIRTVSGRRLPVTLDRKRGTLRTYATVNYAVQSAARELLVDAWWRFATEFGRAETLWFPVHDELVLQVPDGEVAAVVADAEECMRFDFRGVPISATAIELRDEEGVSRWMTSKQSEKYAAARAAA